MDTRRIKKLIELVKETGVGELEVKSGEDSVRISCYSTASPAPVQQHTVLAHSAAPVSTPAASAPVSSPVAEAEAKPAAVEEGFVQKSPMVGSVYLAATPGAKPFVAVGDRVEVGDTLCLIEAMKMFNKIEAETAGVISARLIENESPVEFDQPLFIIDADS